MIRFCAILIATLLSVFSMKAMANINIVLGSIPADREVFQQPYGDMHCHKVSAGYHHGVWINKHRVCRDSRGSGIWVAGHWQCLQLVNGLCLRWDWVGSHWQNGGPRAVVHNLPAPPRAAVVPPAPVVAYAPVPAPRPPVPVPAPGPVASVDAPQPMPSPAGVVQPPAQPA